MTFIQIRGNRYPDAYVMGMATDTAWDGRESRAITLPMTYEEAFALFDDDVPWEIVTTTPSVVTKHTQDGRTIYEDTEEDKCFDCSDFCVAGPITNNRDGTVTVKMGKMTALEEAYVLLLGDSHA